ncbi:hypothetical protein M9Y10_041358 [Tritrichomonas musculus]|uniref:HRDC domain-containing protein n=1 Tax=Tritrichomonas musculus TaxID=1915356 RepID=A0ABR2K4R1_9EUKA
MDESHVKNNNKEFINNLIDLTALTKDFPRDFDYRFKMLDQNFSDQMEKSSTRTLNLLFNLSSYVNLNESNPGENYEYQNVSFSPDNVDSILSSCDKAVQSLLNSRDMDSLDKIPQQQQKKGDNSDSIEKCEYGDYTVFYSKNVSKPAKFVTPNSVYSKIAPINLIKQFSQIPTIVNSNTPNFDILKVINVQSIPNEESFVNDIARSFPKGPLFVASLNHRVRTYRPFSALLLVMTPQYQVYVFDILALRLNLSPLRELLVNSNILKIMYDAGEEIQILAESINMHVIPLLDISLIESPLPQRDEMHPLLIEDIVVPHLKKCVVDWRIRPLNDELLSIAAQSVWHLPKIANEVISRNRDRFLEIINDSNNSWYSFGRMPNLPYKFGYEEQEAAVREVLKHDKSNEITEENKNIILELVKWRDSVAIIEEESPNFIATDQAILKIAKEKPTNLDELFSVLEELFTPQLSTYASDVLLIVHNNSNQNENKNDVLSLFK